jgi:threonine/homoserine/homoserine lactone efflux protein
MFRSTLLKGIILGFSIAAPVGPIGLLCIQRTIEGGMGKGLASGLGAATADALYGCLAAFGFSALTRLLVASGGAVGLVGGLVLCWLGIRILTSSPAPRAAQGAKSGIGFFPDFASTFILTLSNPMTILFFAAVITGMTDAAGAGGALQGVLLVGGVFLGSSAWWLFLSLVVGVFGRRFDEKTRLWVNRLSGTLVLGFGLYAMATKGILLFRG